MSLVLLGLGSNLNRPARMLDRALGLLARDLSALRCSSVYRTEPVGHREQPHFLNLVCCARTELGPRELLSRLLAVEAALGRERSFPNAPRAIDIDLLAHDERVLDEPQLTLPHPRLHERAFVLVPLVELWPEWRHPRLGVTARDLLAALPAAARVERLGSLADVLGVGPEP